MGLRLNNQVRYVGGIGGYWWFVFWRLFMSVVVEKFVTVTPRKIAR